MYELRRRNLTLTEPVGQRSFEHPWNQASIRREAAFSQMIMEKKAVSQMEEKPTLVSSGKKTWKERFRVNWKLAPLKLLLLLMFGAMSSLYPYMTVHMKSLGITMTEIALIYAVLPFVCFVGPPIGGALADRMGNYRLVFVGFSLFCVVTHLLMWFAVPSALPTNIITKHELAEFTVKFPCGNSSAVTSHTSDFPYNGSCNTVMLPENEVRFHGCNSTCKQEIRPKICLQDLSSSVEDCSEYTDFNQRYLQGGSLSFGRGSVHFLNFSAEEGAGVQAISCLLPTSTGEADCAVTCGVETIQTLTCLEVVPVANRYKTIAWYVVWRFLAGIGMNTVSPILDAIAYQMSKDHRGDLGFQRMFSLIGMCAFPPASGYFVGLASANNGTADFSPAFYLFATLFTISSVIAYFMSLNVRMPAEDILKNLGRILRNPKVAVFVIMMFFTGCMWGFLENFLFVFMEELGSPKWLLGMTNTVSALSAIPVVAASTFIMKYLGHTKIVMLVCILYGCRFLAYSFIYNPYHVLPVELLEAFTTSLLWVVASVYCGKIAPDYLATLQGVMGAAHAAIGRGVGSLIGGVMFDYLKPRKTYQIFAGACFAIGLSYAVLQYAWLRRLKNPQLPVGDTDRPSEESDFDHPLTPDEEQNLEEYAEGRALTQSSGETAPLAQHDVRHHEPGNGTLHQRIKDHSV